MMPQEMLIGAQRVAHDTDCYVIAEIGHNHQGKLETAMQMIRVAKECGADAVKFQKRDNKALYTTAMYASPYDNENSYGETYGLHRDALELSADAYRELKQYADELGIAFLATAFDVPSADFLAELDVPAYKMASGDLTNIPLMEHVARIGKPMLISTGGGSMEDVSRAYEAVRAAAPAMCLMQCTAAYPCEPEDMNLNVLNTFREKFPEAVPGLSDHQNGIAMALVAYTLGARVVEKHFTLNRAWRGTDHAFSLEPIGLRKLVRDLRRARRAMGDGVKAPLPAEARPLKKMGKKLVAARALPEGHVLTKEDIAIKSPADGLPPYELSRIVGRRTRKALQPDENITWAGLAETNP